MSPAREPVVLAVTGQEWFETADRPYRLRVDLPLSSAELVAALYEVRGIDADELDNPAGVLGNIAVQLTYKLQDEAGTAAEALAAAERAGAVAAPDWLRLVRERVAETIEPQAARVAGRGREMEMEMEAGG